MNDRTHETETLLRPLVLVLLATLVAASILAHKINNVDAASDLPTLPACQYDEAEQGTDCVWIADLFGNGYGSSFVAIDGELTDVDHRTARMYWDGVER